MSKLAAIPALILFLVGIALALPSEANIGVMIIQSMDDALCDDSNLDNVVCQQMGMYIWTLRILGFLIIIGDLIYVGTQIKEGNFL
tara:strand:- start:218 stop:475 length:258 start_codon:yes stop_codon:yes gene_type:complete